MIGSGGREHALVWKLSESPQVKKLYCAPGNPGIAGIAEIADIPVESVRELVTFAKTKKIDLTLVGPEAPLAGGIADHFQGEGLAIFGPTKAAAQLESSKVFAKDFMHKYHIPTASYENFTEYNEALAFTRTLSYPLVIKASGLAAGKGAVIVKDSQQASSTLKEMMVDKILGPSGQNVVIEDYLEGEELSLMAFCDGKTMVPMHLAQDHKQLLDGDEGPNTGGMGAYSPVPFISESQLQDFQEKILLPTLKGLQKEGIEYKGVLYAGLMLTPSGPKVLEFNCRFGDPEAQAVLPVLETDLAEICQAVLEGKLDQLKIVWKKSFATCVVLASSGYPGSYEKGKEIRGLESVRDDEGLIFHAGTRFLDHKLLSSGGRVLGVTALGNTLEQSIEKAYQLVDKIYFEGMQYRTDIGRKGVTRTSA